MKSERLSRKIKTALLVWASATYAGGGFIIAWNAILKTGRVSTTGYVYLLSLACMSVWAVAKAVQRWKASDAHLEREAGAARSLGGGQ